MEISPMDREPFNRIESSESSKHVEIISTDVVVEPSSVPRDESERSAASNSACESTEGEFIGELIRTGEKWPEGSGAVFGA